jgi:hypothetical protein
VLRPQKAAQQPAAAAPKVAPKPPQEAAEEPQGLPLGYVDEDGAVVVDVAEARRAFMSEEQWAKVTPEQREKLLLLLNV